MWDIILTSEEEAKALAGSILTIKLVRIHTEYIGTRRTKITLYGMPMDVEENLVELSSQNMGRWERLHQ